MRRRLDLREAAAVLAEGELTMAEIATRLGVAKPTLYKLVGSRDELELACVDAETERLVGHVHEHLPADEAGPAVLRAMVAYAADSPGGFRLLFERRGPAAALRRIERRVGDLLRRPDAELAAAALVGAAAGIVSRALAHGRELDADRLAAALVN
jgi:AcrR family transcriptional regulator